MAELLKISTNNAYKWYAIYTRLNHEKSVELSLKEKNIEAFLPKKKTLRIWSDRKKWIEEPLFRPYVFVQVSNKEYEKVLHTPSVLNYVCFEGKAAPIQEKEIDLIRRIVENNLAFEVSGTKYNSTQKVRLINGLFNGYTGEIMRKNGKLRLIVRIDQLSSSIMVDIDQKCIAPL
jgi:transcriptional antiterminator RfaH